MFSTVEPFLYWPLRAFPSLFLILFPSLKTMLFLYAFL